MLVKLNVYALIFLVKFLTLSLVHSIDTFGINKIDMVKATHLLQKVLCVISNQYFFFFFFLKNH